MNVSAQEALQRLQEGNRRFVAGDSDYHTRTTQRRRQELLAGQEPFAVVLGCSDSRVPAEIVFDQGLGDLFVIRVAGNVVAPSLVGSIEFAATKFNTRLVVVLGHSHCGAVEATLQELQRPSAERSPNLGSIVGRIRPSVQTLLETDLRSDPDALLYHAMRANVRASANQIRHASPILEGLVQNDGLLIAGAEYDLATGLVDFFEQIDG
ncbi:MAG: carbonic anhydrase [Candidatus Promineifilaceae bacterium]